MKQPLYLLLVFFSYLTLNTNAQCLPPTTLSATYNNNVSTFNWDAIPGAANYILEIKYSWDNWASAGQVSTNNNFYSFTGLTQGTSFNWRISADCGSGPGSYSAEQTYFTPCPEASALYANNITATTAKLNWTAATGYNTMTSSFLVAYRLANSNNPWISLGYTSSTFINVSGLLSNTSYEWRVNQSCISSNSNYVYSTFTTAYIACNVPTNLNITNVGSSNATISWNAVSGGLTYTVEYKTANSSTWSNSVNTTNSNIIINNLLQETIYDVRVKANCTSGNSTYISKQFTTYSALCASWGNNSSEFIDYFKLGSIDRTSARELGGYINSNLNTQLQIGSTNAGQFSAGYNPGITFGEYFAIYIDYNNNSTFDNNERVVAPIYVNSGATIYNFNISIPNNKATGTYKMRVIMRRSGTSITPCNTGFKGETEDYTVTLFHGNNTTNNHFSLRASENNYENESIEIKNIVYPNPSEGEFTLMNNASQLIKSYYIINVVGQKIIEETINTSDSFKIDLNNYDSGLYILSTLDSEGKMTNYMLQKK